MKMYFNDHTLNTLTIYVPLKKNHIVIGDYEFDEYEIDSKAINEILSGIDKLGLKIKKVTIKSGGFLDIDTKYYKRYSDEILDKLCNKIGNWRYPDPEVLIKNGRLYCIIDGYEIILPKDFRTEFDTEEIRLSFYF